ncbi:MAG: LysM peptidoglycan-binding domain-containing protein [Clostridia bacterium]|nr:LysM peptidoglycan-binding domain-containing protein [Clostridia bacterium]
MDKINTPSGKANVQGDYAGGLIYCDCTGEFVLPDYLPEIRKIIRIDAKAIPSGKFIGSQKAEFAGIVAYTVIYTGAEGELSSTSLSSDYEFSCNLPSSSEGDFAIVADTSVDNTVCRLFGPRKLSLRSTLKSRTHVYARNKISELGDTEDLQRLEKKLYSSVTKCASSGDFSLFDSVAIEKVSSDAIKTNYIEADVLIREARAGNSELSCRGEVLLKCNYTQEGAECNTVCRKIPFEQSFFVEGASDDDSVIAYGRCNSATVSIAENGENGVLFNFDVIAEIDAECVRNEEVTVISDMYSTECNAYPTYKDVAFTESLGASYGNYTVDATRTKSEEELGVSSVIDAKGIAEVKEIVEKDGRVFVLGECKVEMLTAMYGEEKNEYGCSTIVIPFKIETDLRMHKADNVNYDLHIETVSVKGRLDDTTISADAELFVAIRAERSYSERLLDTLKLDDSEKAERCLNEIRVVYPEGNDSLFSIAKKYGIEYEKLAKMNGLPDSSIESPAETHSIDGVTHLIISY